MVSSATAASSNHRPTEDTPLLLNNLIKSGAVVSDEGSIVYNHNNNAAQVFTTTTSPRRDTDGDDNNGISPRQRRAVAWILWTIILAILVAVSVRIAMTRSHRSWSPRYPYFVVVETLVSANHTAVAAAHDRNSTNNIHSLTNNVAVFPPDFAWGVATSAYQIEGAVDEDGRGPTIWDAFVHDHDNNSIIDDTKSATATATTWHIADGSTGDVADDHYHSVESDVEDLLAKQLPGVTAYRFSIAWSRILPHGTRNMTAGDSGGINEAGVAFYQRLVELLLQHNIVPYVTLFHWDLPLELQEQYGGWMDDRTVNAFVDYARVIFERFLPLGVRHFITLNEPWTYAVNGHGSGIHAPGRNAHPTTEPYVVAHNFLRAHARVVAMYRNEFDTAGQPQKILIGMSNCGDFRYPKNSDRPDDVDAADRAMLFQWGWFVEPLVYGDYPRVMRERLGYRLPQFTPEEQTALVGSADFLGLNYYSAFLASTPAQPVEYGGYWADMHVDFSDDPDWKKNDMDWNIVPDGLREMLLWISNRYISPLIYITENGSAVHEADLEIALADEERRSFFEGHLTACARAIEQGVNLQGYFAWSLMDNFEWQFGYQRRFGLCRVNYDTLRRTLKSSGVWYSETALVNGRNLRVDHSDDESSLLSPGHRTLSSGAVVATSHRSIPKKVLIGYGSDCDAVRRAVHDGVNVVMWAFVDVTENKGGRPSVSTNLNITAVRDLIGELKATRFYDDVLHFASVGGWNGNHLNEDISARTWYNTFYESLGDIFDGIDWDLEGNDQMDSNSNFFTMKCLNKMGTISQLAKSDGLFVSVAPPQSYLDISSHRFSRYVNLTDADRSWHSDFSYFGANIYAWMLHEFGDFIDLISIQFYESYSRAAMTVYGDGVSSGEYLIQFVEDLWIRHEQFYVDFSTDYETGLSGQNVTLPLEKLVFGFGNGWTNRAKGNSSSEKALFFDPEQVKLAWVALGTVDILPRGFMFWTINDEGNNGVFLARELHRILLLSNSNDRDNGVVSPL